MVENLLSDVPNAVKEFVEKNDTTRGGSFSESSESVGNQFLNSNDEEGEGNSVVEITPPPPKVFPTLPTPKNSSTPSHNKWWRCLQLTASIKNSSALREEKNLSFGGIGEKKLLEILKGKG